MYKKYFWLLLLTFTINSFCEKSDLRDAIWKGNVAKVSGFLDGNYYDKEDCFIYLEALSDDYSWHKLKDSYKFAELYYKCNYFQKNLSDDEPCNEEDTPELFNCGWASSYEGRSKDIKPIIMLFIKKLCEDPLDRDTASKILAAAGTIGDEETLRLVLNGRNRWNGYCDLGDALYNAVLVGELGAVKLLLQHGARRGDVCVAELIAARQLGYEGIAQLLIDYGADVEEADTWIHSFPTDLKFDVQELATWWWHQCECKSTWRYLDDTQVEEAIQNLRHSWTK